MFHNHLKWSVSVTSLVLCLVSSGYAQTPWHVLGHRASVTSPGEKVRPFVGGPQPDYTTIFYRDADGKSLLTGPVAVSTEQHLPVHVAPMESKGAMRPLRYALDSQSETAARQMGLCFHEATGEVYNALWSQSCPRILTPGTGTLNITTMFLDATKNTSYSIPLLVIDQFPKDVTVLATPGDNPILRFTSHIIVPHAATPDLGVAIWPGLQPLGDGTNFVPLYSGVLQPVISPPMSSADGNQWGGGTMYVNTSTEELIQNLEHEPAGGPYPSDVNAGRISGPDAFRFTAGDHLTFDIAYTAPRWQVAIINQKTGRDFSRFAVNLNGQTQHWALLVWESGSTTMIPMEAANQYPIFVYRNVIVQTQKAMRLPLERYATPYCTKPMLSTNRRQLHFDYCITTAFNPPKPYGLLDEQQFTFHHHSGAMACDAGPYPEYVCRSYRHDLASQESADVCVNPPEGFVINRSSLIHPEPYYFKGERCGMGGPEAYRIASFELQESQEFLAGHGLTFDPATGGINLLRGPEAVTNVTIHVRTVLKNGVKSPWQTVKTIVE